jgi:hypothetical protein
MIAAAPLPGRTVAPLAMTMRLLSVATESPSASVPVQVVVPLLTVGSGAHCANAGPATKNVATIALVCNAHMRTRRFRDAIFPTFMHSPVSCWRTLSSPLTRVHGVNCAENAQNLQMPHNRQFRSSRCTWGTVIGVTGDHDILGGLMVIIKDLRVCESPSPAPL